MAPPRTYAMFDLPNPFSGAEVHAHRTTDGRDPCAQDVTVRRLLLRVNEAVAAGGQTEAFPDLTDQNALVWVDGGTVGAEGVVEGRTHRLEVDSASVGTDRAYCMRRESNARIRAGTHADGTWEWADRLKLQEGDVDGLAGAGLGRAGAGAFGRLLSGRSWHCRWWRRRWRTPTSEGASTAEGDRIADRGLVLG